MAESDILNPPNWQDAGLVFNPNPSYGFSRRMSNNRLLQRPRLGPFLDRQSGNGGHIFPLVWVGTDLTTAQRVVRFYHDFRSGYFTYINVDWSGRHFVGRFTAEPEVIETANGKYTIQGATFEEVPTARMLESPAIGTTPPARSRSRTSRETASAATPRSSSRSRSSSARSSSTAAGSPTAKPPPSSSRATSMMPPSKLTDPP